MSALVRFRQDFPSLLKGAELSISQAGYNTVCDILQAQCRSILVPFTAGGETEQSVRATRLEALGLAIALPENGLNADILGNAIEAALARPKPSAHKLDLNGARAHGQKSICDRLALILGFLKIIVAMTTDANACQLTTQRSDPMSYSVHGLML